MGIFANDKVTFYQVLEAEGREFGPTFSPGDVVEEHGVVQDVRDMEARGRLRALPDPKDLPWHRLSIRFHVVTANTFKVRPEPPAPTYLDEPAVLKKMGWKTPDQLEAARARLGFPKPARKRERLIEGVGFEITALLWSESDIDQWQRDLPRELIGA